MHTLNFCHKLSSWVFMWHIYVYIKLWSWSCYVCLNLKWLQWWIIRTTLKVYFNLHSEYNYKLRYLFFLPLTRELPILICIIILETWCSLGYNFFELETGASSPIYSSKRCCPKNIFLILLRRFQRNLEHQSLTGSFSNKILCWIHIYGMVWYFYFLDNWGQTMRVLFPW